MKANEQVQNILKQVKVKSINGDAVFTTLKFNSLDEEINSR